MEHYREQLPDNTLPYPGTIEVLELVLAATACPARWPC